jgi:hypothetical protein
MSGFLDKVELAFTCPLRWDKLVGGDTERFCGSCQKHVTNLSAMTRHEARSFLRTARGPICVRVEVDDAGRSVHRPSLSIPAMSLSLLAGAPMQTCGDDAPALLGAPPPLMGEVAVRGEPAPVEPVPELLGKVAPVREKMGDYSE